MEIFVCFDCYWELRTFENTLVTKEHKENVKKIVGNIKYPIYFMPDENDLVTWYVDAIIGYCQFCGNFIPGTRYRFFVALDKSKK